MDLQITPDPTDEERAAIAAALAQDEAEPGASPWAGAALPRRVEEPEQPEAQERLPRSRGALRA